MIKGEQKLLNLASFFYENNGEYENTVLTSKGRVKIIIEEIKM